MVPCSGTCSALPQPLSPRSWKALGLPTFRFERPVTLCTCDQPEDRQGARTRDPAVAAAARGRGDPMIGPPELSRAASPSMAASRVAERAARTQGLPDRNPQYSANLRPGRARAPVVLRQSVAARIARTRLCSWRAFRDRAARVRRQAGAIPWPGRRVGPLAGRRDPRPKPSDARAQAGNIDDPDRHGGGQ